MKNFFGAKAVPVEVALVHQLGLQIDDLANAPAVLLQVYVGLQALSSGDIDSGLRYLVGGLIDPKEVKSRLRTTTGKHAFFYTEIIELMRRSRLICLMPRREELKWIEKLDPVLFLMLTETGRAAVPFACAGIISHYKAEVASGKAIIEPRVESAVRASAMVL